MAELAALAPLPGEEEALAGERQRLQQAERRAEAIAAAAAELSPGSHGRDRRNPGPGAALRAAARALQRLIPTVPRDAPADAGPPPANPVDPALAALERAEEALAEAETLLSRLAADAEADPRRLEQAEERLFALRASARKHAVAVAELPGLLDTLSARLAALQTGEAEVAALERAVRRRADALRGRGRRAIGGAGRGGAQA